MYLHLIEHNAQAAGDYDPSASHYAAKMEQEVKKMTLDELIEKGIGWVSDEPLDRDTIVNTYNTYRSEEITPEQAKRHRKVGYEE